MSNQDLRQPLHIFLTGLITSFVTVVSVLYLKKKLELIHDVYFYELNSFWVALVCVAFCFLASMVYGWFLNFLKKPKLFFFFFCVLIMLMESLWVKLTIKSLAFINILNPLYFLASFLLVLMIPSIYSLFRK